MIPDLYFTSCAVLEYILLSANNLTMISNSAFSGLSSIRQLHLHDNMIEEVVDHFMWNLRTLTHLYLDGNKLTRVPSLATGGAMLRRLSVANNKITEITENQMLEVWRMITFNVSYTSITDLSFLSAFRDLRNFYLSNTSILFTEIPLDIIPRLGALSLADNGLVTFPTFPLFSASKSSLQKVDLSQNKIACIDAQHLANMTKLRYFYLSHNNIEKFSDIGCKDGDNIPQAWHELQFPTLQRFYVDNNQLTDIKRDILVTMLVLEWFVASFNKIRFMPFLQAVGSSLRQAHLDHNDISHIEMEHIAGLSSLKTLQLSYNDITYLNLHILGTLNSLQLFDLRCNKLMTPPILTNINFGSSIEILLTNNSYACDSRMCLLENETLLMDGLLCVTPLRVVDRSVESFVDSMYCRKYPRQSLCIQHQMIIVHDQLHLRKFSVCSKNIFLRNFLAWVSALYYTGSLYVGSWKYTLMYLQFMWTVWSSLRLLSHYYIIKSTISNHYKIRCHGFRWIPYTAVRPSTCCTGCAKNQDTAAENVAQWHLFQTYIIWDYSKDQWLHAIVLWNVITQLYLKLSFGSVHLLLVDSMMPNDAHMRR